MIDLVNNIDYKIHQTPLITLEERKEENIYQKKFYNFSCNKEYKSDVITTSNLLGPGLDITKYKIIDDGTFKYIDNDNEIYLFGLSDKIKNKNTKLNINSILDLEKDDKKIVQIGLTFFDLRNIYKNDDIMKQIINYYEQDIEFTKEDLINDNDISYNMYSLKLQNLRSVINRYSFAKTNVEGKLPFLENLRIIGIKAFCDTNIKGNIPNYFNLQKIERKAFFETSLSGNIPKLNNLNYIGYKSFVGTRLNAKQIHYKNYNPKKQYPYNKYENNMG